MAAALGLPLRQWTDTGARGVSFMGARRGDDEDEDSQWVRGGPGARGRDAPPFRRYGAAADPSEFDLPFTSVLVDFEEFLRNILNRSPLLLTTVGSAGGGSSDRGPTSRGLSHPDPALVLLEEVPRPRDAAGIRRVQQALLQFASCSQYPGVLVVSEVQAPGGGRDDNTGGAVHRASLERWLSAALLDHPSVTCLNVNAVNATLMKAALARYASVLPAPVPEDVVAMLAESSEGDLRHAIMSLLMFGKGRAPAPSRPRHSTSDDPGAKRGAKRKPNAEEMKAAAKGLRRQGEQFSEDLECHVDQGLCGKDEATSAVHLIGRLLHAKRGSEGQLGYSPENVMDRIGYDPMMSCLFLQENCPGFYKEIGDLAAAMECYSMVDTMDSFSWRTGKHLAAMDNYVAAIGSRATAGTNTVPPPRGFVSIHKPGCLAAGRSTTANRVWLGQGALTCGVDPVDLASNRTVPVVMDSAAWSREPVRSTALCTLPSQSHALDRLPFLAMMDRQGVPDVNRPNFLGMTPRARALVRASGTFDAAPCDAVVAREWGAALPQLQAMAFVPQRPRVAGLADDPVVD